MDLEMGAPVEEHQEWFEVSDKGQVTIRNEPHPGTISVNDGPTNPCPSKAHTGNRAIVQAQFGRW
jgi:outer membrane usher protein FimD/PapC